MKRKILKTSCELKYTKNIEIFFEIEKSGKKRRKKLINIEGEKNAR